ncbi:MAG: isochorismatase family protein [Neorhizobium sp.]|nr:isochorismatase family protein [Neorhizobium sp.]
MAGDLMREAMIIIDMQMDMQARLDRGQDHVNGGAAGVISVLADRFRAAGKPVIHVRHREDRPGSDFHPHSAGYPAMPGAVALAGEAVFEKTTSSAFASTQIERHLRDEGIGHLYVTGAVAGFCVTSTVRSAADSGFKVTVVRDAVLGFDLAMAGLTARQIFDVSMGLLAADFAEMVDADEVKARLASA